MRARQSARVDEKGRVPGPGAGILGWQRITARGNRARKLGGGKEVTELLFLCAKVLLGMGTRGNFAGNAFDDVHAGALEGFDLVGIVGEQTYGADSEAFQNLSG